MYFFVRFTGIASIALGVVLMLLGAGATVYGFVQNAALIDLVNNYWLASSSARLVDARFYTAMIGLGLFMVGMIASAIGQLMLVFVDLAMSSRETSLILRGIYGYEKKLQRESVISSVPEYSHLQVDENSPEVK
jgi:hypothetical protein